MTAKIVFYRSGDWRHIYVLPDKTAQAVNELITFDCHHIGVFY